MYFNLKMRLDFLRLFTRIPIFQQSDQLTQLNKSQFGTLISKETSTTRLFRAKLVFIFVMMVAFMLALASLFSINRGHHINHLWFRAMETGIGMLTPFHQSGSETATEFDHYFAELQFGSRFVPLRSSAILNYSNNSFRSSSSPILWIDTHGDVRWNKAAEDEIKTYLLNKQSMKGNKSDDQIIDDCLQRRFFVIEQHQWGFFSRYHCFIEQFGQTLYSPWMTLLSYNRFMVPIPHRDDFHDEGILRYFEPVSTCSKYVKDLRMKSIESKLRDRNTRSSSVSNIEQLLYNHWSDNNKFIVLASEKVWDFGYEHIPLRQWMFSRIQVRPTYDLPINALTNHENEHIYRSPELSNAFLAQWLPRNRPWKEAKKHLPGRYYRLTWQDRVFTGFLRYMFVLHFHHFAPRIEQMTQLLAQHWSNYLFDKDKQDLNETGGIFIRRGDKMREDSFWKKHRHWRNISYYVKGLVDEEQRSNRRFSSIFVMTDDVSVMESIRNYSDSSSKGKDESYAREHLRNRQILYNIFAPQACFDPFNRVGFDQFLVSTQFIIQYVQFTVSHSDSNVGRYVEEMIYAKNQWKTSVQSNTFVTDAPDSL